MGLLTPDPGLLFWMVITFGVVGLMIAKKGISGVMNTLGEREQ